MSGASSEQIGVSSGTGPWHPASKLVKSLPMGSPSQDRDAGSNPAGATKFSGAELATCGVSGSGRIRTCFSVPPRRALEMIANTAPFDITHHPAMAIPCGMVDGLPVSMMLAAKHFDEPTIYRAAYAFEQAGDWKRM